MEGKDILYQNGFITITLQALVYGLVFGMLLGSMLLWFKVMKKCISDSHIVYLFGSILPTMGLVISMSFNIINKLKNQYQKIKEANYHMPSKNKFIYYRNVVVILVTYAFESSLDMMNSMISRGYGKAKRTNFHLYSFKKDDFFKLLVIIILSLLCLWGYFGYYQSFYYYPMIQIYQFKLIDIIFFISYLALAAFPLWLGGKRMYKIENFSFTYPEEGTVIKNISFGVNEGDFVVISGKSGCGKTTLLKHLKPSLKPKGEVDGLVILDEEIENDDTKIGFVFQDPNDQIVMDKVWHEIAFGLENIATPLKQMKRRVGEIVNYFNLQNIINKDTQSLSGEKNN